jgi:hypothetical protein
LRLLLRFSHHRRSPASCLSIGALDAHIDNT